MDAAIVAIEEAGAEQLSLRGVALRVGVSHAAPAHHFGDRRGLLTALAAEGFCRFSSDLAQALDEVASAPPLDQLAGLTRAYVDFAEANPGYFALMFQPGMLRTEDEAYIEASEGARGVLRAQIERCQHQGWRPGVDTDALTLAAWALAHGITVLTVQGSFGRHHPEPAGAFVISIASALIGATGEGA